MPSADDELQNTLSEQMKSGWQSNPAMKTLINDYARYHRPSHSLSGTYLL